MRIRSEYVPIAAARGVTTTVKVPVRSTGTDIAGWPVRLVRARLRLLVDERKTSYCDINVSISRMTSVRARWARMYSTAGT